MDGGVLTGNARPPSVGCASLANHPTAPSNPALAGETLTGTTAVLAAAASDGGPDRRPQPRRTPFDSDAGEGS